MTGSVQSVDNPANSQTDKETSRQANSHENIPPWQSIYHCHERNIFQVLLAETSWQGQGYRLQYDVAHR